jgi:hypothetical protein
MGVCVGEGVESPPKCTLIGDLPVALYGAGSGPPLQSIANRGCPLLGDRLEYKEQSRGGGVISERKKMLPNHHRKVGNRLIVAVDRLNKGRRRPIVNGEPCSD